MRADHIRAQATSDVGSPRPMSPDRCAHATTYVTWLMRTGNDRCAYAAIYFDWPMRACHGLCRPDDACRPWPMRAGHNKCHPADAHKLCLTSTNQCVQAKDDVARPRLTSSDRCVQATDYASRPRLTSADRCVQVTDDVGRPRYVRRRLTDVHRPRPMWVDHCLCRLTDVHAMTYVAWLMRVGHDRCAHATTYVDWLMRAYHDLCHLADARRLWPITSGRCAQATINVAQPMRIGHAFADVVYHWPIGRPARHHSKSDRGASPVPIFFPPDNFKHFLTLFSKSFSSFSCGTCSLSVSLPYLALDRIHRSIWASFPNNPTRRQCLVVRQGLGTTRLSPSLVLPSRGLGPGPPLRTLLHTTIWTTELPNYKASSALGVHESQLPPCATPCGVQGATRCVTPRQMCPRPNGFGCNLRSKTLWFTGFCNSHQHTSPRTLREWGTRGGLPILVFLGAFHAKVRWSPDERVGFDNDLSAGSATETLLRLLLPLNDKFNGLLTTSQAANCPRRRDLNISPDHSIGRSDGQCVQRAGT
ncbi:hypothetical protein KY289_029763 [Solanum tuberosum]|nr:hypothetical protein KY289_029763 [Solanum tuberosum]